MRALTALQIRFKLPLLVVAVAVLTSSLLVAVSSYRSQAAAWARVEAQFQSLVAARSEAVRRTLSGFKSDVEFLARVPSTATQIQRLSAAWNGLDGLPQGVLRDMYITQNPHAENERYLYNKIIETNAYSEIHADFHPAFQEFILSKGYADVMLINIAGDVIYSTAKRQDYATNLRSGEWKNTSLAQLFRDLMRAEPGQVILTDFERYGPQKTQPTAFVGRVVTGSAGEALGVIVLAIPNQLVSRVVLGQNTLGKTTEVFVVGSDSKARTPSRFADGFVALDLLPHISNAKPRRADARFLASAGRGQNGQELVAYSENLNLLDRDWRIIVEQDRGEVLLAVRADRRALVVISLAMTLVLSVVGWMFARAFSTPISALEKSMNAVRAGDLEVEIPVALRTDEFGAMGKSLLVLQAQLRLARAAETQANGMQVQQAHVLQSLRTGLAELKSGNFAYKIRHPFPKNHESLRSDFNNTTTRLSTVMQRMTVTAGGIRGGASEISRASDDLSRRTESQTATLNETAAALDLLSGSVKAVTDGAQGVETKMHEARGEAENSGVVVQNAVAAMTKIEDGSGQISKIIGVIDDIAFQTSLLALNAGVEAARAGEAGRGFAVVASEVRALALRSSEAASEIKTVISTSSEQVAEGVTLVGKAGAALTSIVERVNQISGFANEIATGSAEQSAGVGEITSGVLKLNQVSEQNAAMIKETAAAGHLINQDAGRLTDLVSHYKLGAAPLVLSAAQRIGAPSEGRAVLPQGAESRQNMPEKITIQRTANGTERIWEDF